MSDQKQRPNLRQIQQPVREQMGRCVQCSVLFSSQFITLPGLQIPSPRQTFVLATTPGAPGGWMGGEVSYWTGGCFHCVIWSLSCEERGYGKIPKGDSEKGSKREISVQENHRLNGNGVGLEVHRFRLTSSALPS